MAAIDPAPHGGRANADNAPGEEAPSTTEFNGVDDYAARGWARAFPLPPGKKAWPPDGLTGANGKPPSADQRADWRRRWPADSNVGVAMPDDIIGVDVDQYDKDGEHKRGWDNLRAELDRLGVDLPATVRSSSRGAHNPSGIRLYRVPPRLKWKGAPVDGVELITWSHRYAVVWPSIHPEGRPYHWYDDAGWWGEPGDPCFPPNLRTAYDRLPELPWPLVEAWTKPTDTPADNAPAAPQRADRADWHPLVVDALDDYAGRPPGASRHDTARDVAARLCRYEQFGRPGATSALDELRDRFVADVAADRGAEGAAEEWRRILDGGRRLVETTASTVEADHGPDLEVGPTTPPLVNNPAEVVAWLRENLGTGPTAGMFRRGHEIVRAARIGEDGYQPLTDNDRDDDGTQLRPLHAGALRAYLADAYEWRRKGRGKGRPEPALPPQDAAKLAVDAPETMRALRVLAGVTHTPVVRPDGTILDRPGYDESTRLLYLPEPGVHVPAVPDEPTPAQVAAAVKLLDDMLADFCWAGKHDKANYLGALLTPLVRELAPPPYRLLALGAHQPGSGKSLLAQILRVVHGGVFRSETPENEAEFRKQVTAILSTTTGPVVQFDNVTGVLRSSVLAGLLTSPTWSDRPLGATAHVEGVNDRLWVVTGNNVTLGGDLVRRTLWVTIDPGIPNPERRENFRIPNLITWATERRGDIIAALLTLVRAWAAAGAPTRRRPADSYQQWTEVVAGILDHAGVEGTFAHLASARQTEGVDDEEWAGFLAAIYKAFGTEPWTVHDLLAKVDTSTHYSGASGPEHGRRNRPIPAEALPGPLADSVLKTTAGAKIIAKPLGKWLGFREGQWAGDLAVRKTGAKDRRDRTLWRIEAHKARGAG